MKRLFCLALCLLILCNLWGCQQEEEPAIQVPVEFFYLRADFSYKDNDTIISSEFRESAGHEEDLLFLLNLYLKGPKNAALSQPFPGGCSVISCESKANAVSLILSDHFAALSGMPLTTACVCLAKTLSGLTGIDTVMIQAQTQLLDGQKAITIQDGAPILLDDYIAPAQLD